MQISYEMVSNAHVQQLTVSLFSPGYKGSRDNGTGDGTPRSSSRLGLQLANFGLTYLGMNSKHFHKCSRCRKLLRFYHRVAVTNCFRWVGPLFLLFVLLYSQRAASHWCATLQGLTKHSSCQTIFSLRTARKI